MGNSQKKSVSLNSSFMQAIMQGDVSKVDSFVLEHPHLAVKPVNDNLWSPLMLACNCGSFNVVKYFVEECSVDIDEQDYIGFTALIHVVYLNKPELLDIVDYLCNKGANLNIETNSGITAYAMSLTNGSRLFKTTLENHQRYGYWAKHPFTRRKKLLWMYKKSSFKRLSIYLIKDICMYM